MRVRVPEERLCLSFTCEHLSQHLQSGRKREAQPGLICQSYTWSSVQRNMFSSFPTQTTLFFHFHPERRQCKTTIMTHFLKEQWDAEAMTLCPGRSYCNPMQLIFLHFPTFALKFTFIKYLIWLFFLFFENELKPVYV